MIFKRKRRGQGGLLLSRRPRSVNLAEGGKKKREKGGLSRGGGNVGLVVLGEEGEREEAAFNHTVAQESWELFRGVRKKGHSA